ncbi:hypothetical protein V1514DRAFT_330635 [Lipomyces japonicus]|uniref:uncharacterized protein n=1 Tax=Lipomyces japonicus TaxID=56871 RepID=UPI0034CED7C0
MTTNSLKPRGIIASVEIAVYVLTTLFVFISKTRYRIEFRKQGGWVYLILFLVLRITSCVLVIVLELTSNPTIGLVVAQVTLTAIALTPLLSAAIGFLKSAAKFGTGQDLPRFFVYALRLSKLALLAAIVIGIIAGSDLANGAESVSSANNGRYLTKVSALILLGVFVSICVYTAWFLSHGNSLGHFRTIVIGVGLSLPFFLVRIIYSILSAFTLSGSGYFSGGVANKFNTINGSWPIYLVMAVLSQFFITVILFIAGVAMQKDIPQRYQNEQDLENASKESAPDSSFSFLLRRLR